MTGGVVTPGDPRPSDPLMTPPVNSLPSGCHVSKIIREASASFFDLSPAGDSDEEPKAFRPPPGPVFFSRPTFEITPPPPKKQTKKKKKNFTHPEPTRAAPPLYMSLSARGSRALPVALCFCGAYSLSDTFRSLVSFRGSLPGRPQTYPSILKHSASSDSLGRCLNNFPPL